MTLGQFTNNDTFIKRGTYKPTEVDEIKAKVDFRITACDSRTTIEFNHPVELKENRSIKRANCGGYVYHVTDKALESLKKQFTFTTDF